MSCSGFSPTSSPERGRAPSGCAGSSRARAPRATISRRTCASNDRLPRLMAFDLAAYLERIGYAGTPHPDRTTLAPLQLAHATHIPFENLDILLQRPVRLDIESLQAKLVEERRGGYCFEHNLLFAAALEAAGFSVTPLAGRVRYRTRRTLPRTHMLLLVSVGGADWIADVGFGLEGL